MANYSTQESVSVTDYRGAQHPDRLIAEVEERVRRTLEGALHAESESERSGDVMTGWLVVTPVQWLTRWAPGDELPTDAQTLICRGRRYA